MAIGKYPYTVSELTDKLQLEWSRETVQDFVDLIHQIKMDLETSPIEDETFYLIEKAMDMVVRDIENIKVCWYEED